jgi:hypothetical protein
MARFAAGAIALVCWVGIALNLWTRYSHTHDLLASLWALARFFTILSNVALAIGMTALALGRRVSATVVGGMTLAILLVGVVYATLLKGLHPLSGAALIADYLLHDASPILAAIYWLLFVPRGRVGWSAPWYWLLFPLVYFAYALARGRIDGRYPYPFIDVAKLGWTQVALNGAGIAFAFILAGFLLVWIDRWRPLGPRRGKR